MCAYIGVNVNVVYKMENIKCLGLLLKALAQQHLRKHELMLAHKHMI